MRDRDIPRLALSPNEASAALGVSRDYFDEHIAHELRIVRRGRRKLVPVAELERWLERESALTVGGERIEVVVRDRDVLARTAALLGGGEAVVDEDARRVTVPAHGGARRLAQVVRDLDEAGIVMDDIGLRRPTLDDVFLSLTGHASELAEGDAA